MACPTPTAGPSSPSREMSAGPASTVSALDLVTAAGLRLPAVLGALGSDPSGLDDAEAGRRLGQVGPNVLAERRVTAAGVLGRQLRNPLLILLLGAAVVSGATGDPADAVIIAFIVALSVGLGFVNELRSERAAAAQHAGSPPGGRRVARRPSAAGDGGGARSRRRPGRPRLVPVDGHRRAPGRGSRGGGGHRTGHRVRSHPSGSASTRPRPPSRSGSSGSRSCWSWWPAC